MKRIDYLKDNIFVIVANLLAMIVLSLFLVSVGNTIDTIVVILIGWTIFLCVIGWMKYFTRKKYLKKLLELTDELEERYLIAELMEKPGRADDKVFYKVLQMAGKSMLEQVASVKRERGEYKEYIERWIHEVKTPIAALKLLCNNHKSDLTRTMLVEIERLNHFAEQALYYARSENIEKDYLIREVDLAEVIHNSIAENKQLLLSNQVCIHMEECEQTVYTDEKWVNFILNQLIVNAVKYKKDNPQISFEVTCQGDKVLLWVRDNGVGIPASDLPRIFEKGFTGSNGRVEKASTGIGLYLSKRLCDKLGIHLQAFSDGEGTAIRLIFFQNHFLRVQD